MDGRNTVLDIRKRFEEKDGFERKFESTFFSNPKLWHLGATKKSALKGDSNPLQLGEKEARSGRFELPWRFSTGFQDRRRRPNLANSA